MPIRKLPELLLPAGGFDSALAAFEGGADAVYLGFKDFSARRQARNFDRLEYRRLLAHASALGKSLYVTLNTVVTDQDYPGLVDLLGFLSAFPPGAIIFQDWGLARLIKSSYPSLHLHASTQTAIQTPAGARRAAALGVERIVLPREFGLEDLRRFGTEAPGLEYEVFVHGALCYSFSGLCLASGLLLDRSANRGECAQLCRSWYTRGKAPAGTVSPGSLEQGYWFSCRDLSLVEALGPLVEAGAASLKVEGRMKSPEYAYSVARLYRAGLDALAGKASGPESLGDLEAKARIAFSRASSRAYLGQGSGEALIDSAYPGHRGLEVGTVLASADGRATVELDGPLGLRDGLLWLDGEAGNAQAPGKRSPLRPLAFAVTSFSDAASGKSLFLARPGTRVELAVPEAIPPGTRLHRISAREDDLRKPSPEEFPPSLQGIPAVARIDLSEGGGRLRLDLDLPHPRGLASRPHSLLSTEVLPLQPGRKPGGFAKVLELLVESGDWPFRLAPRLAQEALTVDGQAIPLADLFVPPSLLKKAKNEVYEALGVLLDEEGRDDQEGILATLAERPSYPPSPPQPPRAALVFPHPSLPRGLPYATPRVLASGAALPEWGGYLWLPLAPLVLDFDSYAEAVRKRAGEELARGNRLVLGLDAFHHLDLAESLQGLPGAAEGLGFFGDIHLYTASVPGEAFWLSRLPGLLFLYASMEAGKIPDPVLPRLAVGEGFGPPLFLSKGCYMRHNLFGGTCPPGCGKSYIDPVEDRDRKYRVLVEDCITMVFQQEAP